jgi:hypothetical protein
MIDRASTDSVHKINDQMNQKDGNRKRQHRVSSNILYLMMTLVFFVKAVLGLLRLLEYDHVK